MKRPERKLFRIPRLESLEGRRVMAANVTQFTPTDSGFVVQFSEAIDTSKINLYTTEGGALGAADVTLQGASGGVIAGSAIFSSSGTSMTFVATGGVLPADAYTVTLRSAADGFTGTDGALLDGESNSSLPSGNGTAGGNFSTTFTVSAGSSIAVGFADIARGPGQALQGPASGSGNALPSGLTLNVTNGAGVTSLSLSFQYDPALMTVTDVQLGSDAPSGSQVQANFDTPGVVSVSFFALAPLTAAQTRIIQVMANVPETATYGRAHVLDITSVEVNAGALTAKADDAIHVVAYPGDANANRRYDAEDARLVARVGVGLDSGFVSTTPTSSTVTTPTYPRIDPRILGDVTGVDGISPLDASDILRKVVGLSVPNIPALPSQAPTDISLSATSIASGQPSGTTVGTFTATDPDTGDTHTYSLVSGTGSTDNSSFTISGNQLRTAAVFDATQKASYSIRVRATDSSGKSFEKNFTISVTSTNSAPTDVTLSSTTIAESQTVGAVVGTFTTTDPNAGNTHTYALVSGTGSTDNGSFTITNNQLILNTTLNFETKSSYSIRVRTTDNGGLSFEKVFTISVTNANEAPTDINISGTAVPADAAIGTTVGVLSAVDPDSTDTLTFTLVSGTGDTDNGRFTISGNQLRTAVVFTTQTTFSVRVRATDAAGLTFEKVITGTIATGNVAPIDIALSSSSVAENTASGTTVGTLTASDPNAGNTHTFALVSGDGSTDNGSFTITGNELKINTAPDFETKSSYSIRVTATDQGGLTFTKVLTINVTNVNEAPTDAALSDSNITDGDPSGTVVGTFSATDPDASDSFTYSLVAGTGDTDNASFGISGNQLLTGFQADRDTKSSYTIRVRVQDAGGLSFERNFTVTVVGNEQAPTAINLSSSSLPENNEPGALIGQLSSVDANAGDSHTYSLVTGDGDTDNALFEIDGNQLQAVAGLDFEVKSSYSIRVRSTDSSGLSFEQVLNISVTNVNEAPTDVALSSSSLPENSPIGTSVGQLSTTDPDTSDSHTYELVSGNGDTDNGAFTIDGSTLRVASLLDLETQSTYSIRLRSTDVGGLFIDKVLTVTVTNVNEAATQINLSSSTIVDGTLSGATVAMLTSNDPDAGDTISFSLVAGDGDADNSAFTIVGDQLQLTTDVDMATKSSYSIRIRAQDAAGLALEQSVTLTVTEAPTAPTAIQLSVTSINENMLAGSVVGLLSSTDENSADTHTYSLVSGSGDSDNAAFEIVGNELRTTAQFDFETKSSYSVRIRTTDSSGLTFEQSLVVSVTDVNEAPTDLAVSNATLPENSPIGSAVGQLSTVDPDAADTHSYELVSGDGDTDNALFEIDGTTLQVSSLLDFETQSSYSIRVRSTDAAGLSFEKVLNIVITNVNEAATQINLTATSVVDGTLTGATVATLSSNDPDAGDALTYTLVAGSGDDDNAAFEINDDQLILASDVDMALQSSYSIRVRVEDAAGLSFEQIVTITVTEAPVAPTAIDLSVSDIDENMPIGSVVGMLSSTDDNAADTHAYTLVAGGGDDDNDKFEIVGNQLRTTALFDFEAQDSYTIRIRTTDSAGLTFEDTFIISVNDINEAPSDIALDSDTLPEDSAIGTAVGQLSSVDPDAADSHTFELVSGDGDTDNAAFEIDGTTLQTLQALDFETKNSYSIRVRSTDAGGLTTEKVFTISVTNVNEAPTQITLSATSVVDGTLSGATVATLSSDDPDAGDSFTFSLVAGAGDTDNAAFTIVDNQLVLSSDVDMANQSSYSIRLRVEDTAGLSHEQTVTITVTEAPVAPTAVMLSASSINENMPVGSVVGLFSSTDANAADTHTYQLVSGTGDTDNAQFEIVDNELRTTAQFDFESQDSYTIRVRTTDSSGLVFEQSFTITVVNVNEAPTALNISNNTIADLQTSGTVVGLFSTIDPDAGDTFSYTLVSGDGDTDNARFQIVNDQLVINEDVDAAIQQMYSVRVRSVDAGGLEIEQIIEILVNN